MSLPLWLPPLLAFVATIISGLTLFGEFGWLAVVWVAPWGGVGAGGVGCVRLMLAWPIKGWVWVEHRTSGREGEWGGSSSPA